ncbi:MAG: 50S ribosomal protein L22 [Candidatus Dormibacteria bacterium]
MEVLAKARYMRITPRKARLVAATVVGLPVKDALVILQFTPKAAAKEVAKVVKSAAANATNNFNQDEDTLVVKSIIVNEGPTLKRGQARARGMFFSIFKRTCHITAVVDSVENAPRGKAGRGMARVKAGVARPARTATGKTKSAPTAKAKAAAARTAEVKAEKAENKRVEAAAESAATPGQTAEASTEPTAAHDTTTVAENQDVNAHGPEGNAPHQEGVNS